MDFKANRGFQREFEAELSSEDVELPPVRISYDFMLQILMDAMKYNKDDYGSKTKAPNHFILYLNPEDRKQREKYEDELITEFRKDLLNYRPEITQTDKRDIVVEFSEDEELKHLQVGVTVEMVAPEEKLANIPLLPDIPRNQPNLTSDQPEEVKVSDRAPVPTDEFIEVTDEGKGVEKTEDSTVGKTAQVMPEKTEHKLMVGIFMNENHIKSLELTANKPLLFGRDSTPEIDFQLDDINRMISREHFRLTKAANGIICDVIGTHGLDINGVTYAKGKKIRLNMDDVISEIGGAPSYKISFHRDSK